MDLSSCRINIPKDGTKISASFELDVTFPFGVADRGDAAMIAYGATHFLLASGDRKKAEEIWPLKYSIKLNFPAETADFRRFNIAIVFED